MREAIRKAIGDQAGQHFGLAYDVLAPKPAALGEPDIASRRNWLRRCRDIRISEDYAEAFARWKETFPAKSWREVKAQSRLLIGHGNPSGSDVGLTVHHTWGVPVLPGSALKGVLAHYIDAIYGHVEEWHGPAFSGSEITIPPGKDFRFMFGAAPTTAEKYGLRGAVEFHDALYVPGSAPHDQPFAIDVLTVHQPKYYHSNGGAWPSDWDSPNPVGFMTVTPGASFLLAVTVTETSSDPGLAAWRNLALDTLVDALKEWGIGGKTSAGYGRLAPSNR